MNPVELFNQILKKHQNKVIAKKDEKKPAENLSPTELLVKCVKDFDAKKGFFEPGIEPEKPKFFVDGSPAYLFAEVVKKHCT